MNDDGDVVCAGSIPEGTIYIYTRSGSTWSLRSDNGLDSFGANNMNRISLSGNGNVLAINDHDGGVGGTVKIYEYDGIDTWNLLGGTLDLGSSGDRFGRGIALSTTGEYIS
jgi:hypothetical protein